MSSDPNLQIILSAKNISKKVWEGLNADIQKVGVSTRGLTRSWSAFNSVIGTYLGFELVKSFANAGIEMDRMSKSMEVISGSYEKAESNIKFLRDESNKYGQVFQDQIKGFNLISAATKGSRLEGEKTRDMYSNLLASMTAFQLSQDDAYHSVRAIQQMLAKGLIQAEEFRGQFGERIPVAFEAMKIATGSTTQELNKFMKEGLLESQDVVPDLLAIMKLMVEDGLEKASHSAQAEINRLKNAWFNLRVTMMAEGGITDILAEQTRYLTESINSFLIENKEEIKDFIETIVHHVINIKDFFELTGIAIADWGNKVYIGLETIIKLSDTLIKHTYAKYINDVIIPMEKYFKKFASNLKPDTSAIERFRDKVLNSDFVENIAANVPGAGELLDEWKKMAEAQDKQTESIFKWIDSLDTAEIKVGDISKEIDAIFDTTALKLDANAEVIEKAYDDLYKKIINRGKDRGTKYTGRDAATIKAALDALKEQGKLRNAQYVAAAKAREEERKRIEQLKEELAILQQIRSESENIAQKNFSSLVSGFEGNLSDVISSELEGVAVELFTERFGSSLQDSISRALHQSFNITSDTADLFGGALTNIGMGIAGAGISAVGGMAMGALSGVISGLFDGSSGAVQLKEQREYQRELNENLKDLAEEVKRNIEMQREYSTYTSGLNNIQKSYFEMLEEFNALYTNSKPNLVVGYQDVLLEDYSISQMKGFLEMMEGFSAMAEWAGAGSVGVNEDTKALGAVFENVIEQFELFTEDLRTTSANMLTEAGDAFRSQAEIEQREFGEAAKDLLKGFVEVYELEGSFAPGSTELAEFASSIMDWRELSAAILKASEGTTAYNDALKLSNDLLETAALAEKSKVLGLQDAAISVQEYMSDLFGETTDLEFALRDVNNTFDTLEDQIFQLTGWENTLSSKRSEAIDYVTSLYDAEGNLIETTEQLTGLFDNLSSLVDSIQDYNYDLMTKDFTVQNWQDEIFNIAKEIGELNVNSDTYNTQVTDLMTKQFEATKELLSLAEKQLDAYLDAQKSIEDQIFELLGGSLSQSTSIDAYQERFQSLYSQATGGDLTALKSFQSFIPDWLSTLATAGYSTEYLTQQAAGALSSISTGLNQPISDLSSIIDTTSVKTSATTLNLSLKWVVDGKELGYVIADQIKGGNEPLIVSINGVRQ